MPKPLLKDADLKGFDWEDDEGNLVDGFDPKKIRAYVLGLMNDKIKAQNAREKANEERDEAREQVSELESAVDPSKVDDTVKQLQKEKRDLEKRLGEPSERELRLEVALEKGLTLAQAMRLHGDDKDALETDADAYLEEIGGGKKADDEGADEHGGERQPQRPGRNNGRQRDDDPVDDGKLPEIDWANIA